MNYLNMALAREGMLGDQMFAFDQREPRSLMVNWNKTAEVSALLSDVYFAIGDIASAQEMAFEGNVAVHGYGSPRMLMRLVQTNLIYGAYPVAENIFRCWNIPSSTINGPVRIVSSLGMMH